MSASSSTSAPTCRAEGCGKPASFRCPTCKDLGADDDSHFCSKECFKSAWEVHKLVHKRYKDAQAQAIAVLQAAGALGSKAGVRLPKGFEGFSFTGKLRPGEVSPQMKVPSGILKPEYADTGIPRTELNERGTNIIPVYSAKEIAGMKEVCRIGREVLDVCAAALRVGISTDEIDRICFAATIERGGYPSPLNYHGFPKSICTSINEIICHGIPDSRPLQDGDIVNLDVSVYYKGFHADLNETYCVGNVDAAGRRLVKNAYDSLAAAIAVCRPGFMYRDVGAAIQKVAHAEGFSVVKNYCGHGVGKLFHTTPNVPHYAKNKAVGVMRVGHIFTIEPMINEGVAADETWPDNWTAATRDGKRSAQFEHTLLVTEDGVEVLTSRVGAPKNSLVWDEAAVNAPKPAAGAAAGAASSSSSSAASAAMVVDGPAAAGAGVAAAGAAE